MVEIPFGSRSSADGVGVPRLGSVFALRRRSLRSGWQGL